MSDSESRWLNAEAAARYISVRVDALPRLVKAGRIPKPNKILGERMPRWDRNALDAAFDGRSDSTDMMTLVRAVVEEHQTESTARRKAKAG